MRAAAATMSLLLAACVGSPPGADPTTSPKAPPEASPTAAVIAAIPGADVLVRGERSVADVTIKDLRSIAAARNAFGLDIFRLLAREDGNIVLGPDSISNALTMTYAGARGSTAAEMRSAMHLDLSDDALHRAAGALDASLLEANDIDGIEMARGTRLFGLRDFPFKESFLETLSRDYGAPLATLDFTADPDHARAVINDWVAQLTRELIPELMGPGKVTGNTRLVIVDAQYMKAVWDEPFDPDWTGDAPFHLPDGSTIDVPMMRNHLMIPIAGGDDWVAGELAYKGGRLTMLVIVPQDLASFEAHLDKDRLDSIVADLREQSYVPISLPRFEVSQHSDLVPLMRELGIEDLFGGGDLSGISDSDLWVGGVEHEAVVKVNEEGTEAAAATGAEMPGSAPAVEVRADRPFLFFVRDRHTGSILFMGRVADPRPE